MSSPNILNCYVIFWNFGLSRICQTYVFGYITGLSVAGCHFTASCLDPISGLLLISETCVILLYFWILGGVRGRNGWLDS